MKKFLISLGVISPPLPPGYRRLGQRAHDRQRFSRSAEPLPEPRRPLKPPLLPESSAVHAQEHSPFFIKLSPEIRQEIFREVLAPQGDELLHVAMTDKRLCGSQCIEDRKEALGWQHQCFHITGVPDGAVQGRQSWESLHLETVSGLLCSCRRLYSEAIPILYTKNFIHVRQSRTVATFPKVMRSH
jgi:hypothetical protein